MLVLSRKKEQTIKIGDDIEIVVMRTSRDATTLGIMAPDDVLILRGEVERFSDEARAEAKEGKK